MAEKEKSEEVEAENSAETEDISTEDISYKDIFEKNRGETSSSQKKASAEDEKKAEKEAEKKSLKFENVIFYSLAFFLCCTYGAYSYDKTAFQTYASDFTPLAPLVALFERIEQFSPFIEFLEDDNWATLQEEKEKEKSTPAKPKEESYQEKIFTREELKKYDGSEGSPGIYLAMLGQVFDVSKAPQFYGPEGGYGFFAGRDASRAFVTGDFDEEGLIDDVAGLSNSDYIGLDEWIGLYHKDYRSFFVRSTHSRNQLTQNMTTDCSLKYKFSARKVQVQSMIYTSNCSE
jgi:predicted heme/steroid binding protein